MTREPYRLDEKVWAFDFDMFDADARAKLEDLPGVRIGQGRVVGLIDGVSAAAVRLGGEPALRPVRKRPILLDNLRSENFRSYQYEGVQALRARLSTTGGALLADEMGLGKTRQAIRLAQWLAGRVLVVCPAYVRETWRSELRACGIESISILGPPSDRRYTLDWERAPHSQWLVTSYELAGRAASAAFPQSGGPNVLVMDEAHLLCGRDTKRSNAVDEIAAMTPYRLALTGTPMWSRPRDFFRVLDILLRGKMGNRYAFDVAYCGGKLNQWGGMENKGATRQEELKLRLSYYMVRRTKAEVLKELPALTRQIIWVDADEGATSALCSAKMRPGANSTVAALKATLKAKLQPAVELAAEAGRFVLFTWLREHAQKLWAMLEQEKGVECVCITGEDSHVERQAKVERAKTRRIGVVATIDSLGAGVNLQDVASYGIMHALDWTPLKLAQAEARIHRLGQTEPVQWVYLACRDSMDEPVIHTVVEKLDQFRGVLDAPNEKGLRDSLGDSMGESDDRVLKAIYEELENE